MRSFLMSGSRDPSSSKQIKELFEARVAFCNCSSSSRSSNAGVFKRVQIPRSPAIEDFTYGTHTAKYSPRRGSTFFFLRPVGRPKSSKKLEAEMSKKLTKIDRNRTFFSQFHFDAWKRETQSLPQQDISLGERVGAPRSTNSRITTVVDEQ